MPKISIDTLDFCTSLVREGIETVLFPVVSSTYLTENYFDKYIVIKDAMLLPVASTFIIATSLSLARAVKRRELTCHNLRDIVVRTIITTAACLSIGAIVFGYADKIGGPRAPGFIFGSALTLALTDVTVHLISAVKSLCNYEAYEKNPFAAQTNVGLLTLTFLKLSFAVATVATVFLWPQSDDIKRVFGTATGSFSGLNFISMISVKCAAPTQAPILHSENIYKPVNSALNWIDESDDEKLPGSPKYQRMSPITV